MPEYVPSLHGLGVGLVILFWLMTQAAALAAHGLTRDFRGFRAVDGVDLAIAAGEVHALVGPNGAGKTTLFNLLTGFLAPSSGRIELAGRDITGLPPERIARLGV